MESSGDPARDQRRSQIHELEVHTIILAQLVANDPPTFDIGLDTAAYADPLLADTIRRSLTINHWTVVRVLEKRPVEELILVEVLPDAMAVKLLSKEDAAKHALGVFTK